MKIELLTFAGCPRAPHARSRLREALRLEGLPDSFDEVDVDRETPHGPWGSPTILIDGIDAAGEAEPNGAAACRLVVPTVDELRARLRG